MTGSWIGADGVDGAVAFFAHSTVTGNEKNANNMHTRAAINFNFELKFITTIQKLFAVVVV